MPAVFAPIIPAGWQGGRRHGGLVALPGGLRRVETHQGNNNIWSQPNGTQLGEVYTYLDIPTDTWTEYWVLYDIDAWHNRIHGSATPAAFLEHVATGIDPWGSIRAALAGMPGAQDWRWFRVSYQYSTTKPTLGGSPQMHAALVKQSGVEVGRMVHKDIGTTGGEEQWAFNAGFTTPTSAAAFGVHAEVQNRGPDWILGLPNHDRYIKLSWTNEEAL